MINKASALDKQDAQFCDYIKAVNKIGNVIFFIERESKKELNNLFHSLMQHAFRGEL
jgi:hypothetical protein